MNRDGRDSDDVTHVAMKIFVHDHPVVTCQRDVDDRIGDFVAAIERTGRRVIARGTVRFGSVGDICPVTGEINKGPGPWLELRGWEFADQPTMAKNIFDPRNR